MATNGMLTVLNPMGFPPKVTRKPLAPRLDTLDGKTVYLVDCRFDDSDVFLKQMQAWFARAHAGREDRRQADLERLHQGRSRDLGGDQGARATPPSSASATEAPARRRSPRTR